MDLLAQRGEMGLPRPVWGNPISSTLLPLLPLGMEDNDKPMLPDPAPSAYRGDVIDHIPGTSSSYLVYILPGILGGHNAHLSS